MFDLDSVKELFKTEPNTAFFWSGLGENGAEIAKETAKANGGVTLEISRNLLMLAFLITRI